MLVLSSICMALYSKDAINSTFYLNEYLSLKRNLLAHKFIYFLVWMLAVELNTLLLSNFTHSLVYPIGLFWFDV
jgi:hypothetical protein